ncbi:hypothetical protein [Vibrio brasiliensis]|uniref:Uncharacterized protein n=1 Tax=Vibrio brasiliensis LMG 20546 TaxID=945543 RepID=E8LYQ9_9VIBR|nr:hypothetical protein [Vibrio brasiliensis]EGA64173.1 hypothetical protein VIBR0546_02514 [Vibrio brasiliensis LMG 20546]
MTNEYDKQLPTLEEFELENVVFKVVDPSSLPSPTFAAFETFMAGSTVPHRRFVYSHDYARFCSMVREGHIIIDDDN